MSDDEYEITGKKQRVWILAVILLVVSAGLVYVLSWFA